MNIRNKLLDYNGIAAKFSILFIIIGIVVNQLLLYFSENSMKESAQFSFGILFILTTAIVLYWMISYMEIAILRIETSYKILKRKDKNRLAPYEFSLNKSADLIHWLSLEGKFLYVNESMCKMSGYTREEFKSMYIEDLNPNFTRKTAQLCMEEIKSTVNWKIETTHKKKDGVIYSVEATGHAFNLNGKDYICAFGRDITQSIKDKNSIKTINIKLQKSVNEKEILLKEIHHRVKNNMEIISSLLNMQSRRSQDENFKEAMKQSQSRIHTMALVHEFLYLGENIASINAKEYIEKLVQDIKELYISQNTKLDIELNIDNLIFSANRCIQIGMILHELCVNSLKYAFKEDRKNLLCIHIKSDPNNINIKIRDNGEKDIDMNTLQKKDSIGLQLIESIVDFQLQGKIEFINNKGLECNISFPKKEEK